MKQRSLQLNQWLDQLGYRDYQLSPASEDASFRSYLRLQVGSDSLIVMDAPPDLEPCDQFIMVAGKLRAAGLSAPEVLSHNPQDGFLLLTDYGSTDYLSQLNTNRQSKLFHDALDALLTMQVRIDSNDLPLYDEALLNREMDLFHDWFLNRLMGIELDASQQAQWQLIKARLIDNALAQPQLFVHRDFHSRNLMVLDQANPGILDFQDAVRGPLTYDLVSLLRDCYFTLPGQSLEKLLNEYVESARAQNLFDASPQQCLHWFNLMGLQRHLKAVGIFSRLNIRDGKAGYLGDIPRTLGYLAEVSAQEESMADLSSLIKQLDLTDRVTRLGEQELTHQA